MLQRKVSYLNKSVRGRSAGSFPRQRLEIEPKNQSVTKTTWKALSTKVRSVLPAPVRNLKKQYSHSSEDSTGEERIDSGGPEGFRFIDISVLASLFKPPSVPIV